MTYRVMTVCTGNICRSPMAEVVLRKAFTQAGLAEDVVIESRGISDEEHGNPVDSRARRVLVAHGYDTLDGHAARRISSQELAQQDLVLPMTSHHASTLRRLASTVGADTSNDDSAGLVDGPIIRMYRSFDPDQPPLTKWQSESVLDVDDPWYGGPSDFEACLSEIEDASTAIVDYVKVQLAAR